MGKLHVSHSKMLTETLTTRHLHECVAKGAKWWLIIRTIWLVEEKIQLCSRRFGAVWGYCFAASADEGEGQFLDDEAKRERVSLHALWWRALLVSTYRNLVTAFPFTSPPGGLLLVRPNWEGWVLVKHRRWNDREKHSSHLGRQRTRKSGIRC